MINSSMGVNNQNSTPQDSGSNGDIVLIEDLNNIPDDKNKGPVSKSPKKVKKYVPRSYEREVARQSRRKSTGARQNRRNENTQFLLTLGDGEELVEGDTGFLELVEPAVTAFDQLFLEQEKMKIWDSFMQQSEDEQERLLSGEWVPLPIPTTEGDKADSEAMEKVADKRTVHPAFTPEQCYQRIDVGFRSFLKKKHVPWGSLEHLEDEIIPFFEEWPSSVYLSQLPGPVDRLLLHALCQYVGLCSHSYNSDDGIRHTQVENRSATFTSPSRKMSEFLRSKH